jgi:hypothetical protein
MGAPEFKLHECRVGLRGREIGEALRGLAVFAADALGRGNQ